MHKQKESCEKSLERREERVEKGEIKERMCIEEKKESWHMQKERVCIEWKNKR